MGSGGSCQYDAVGFSRGSVGGIEARDSMTEDWRSGCICFVYGTGVCGFWPFDGA